MDTDRLPPAPETGSCEDRASQVAVGAGRRTAFAELWVRWTGWTQSLHPEGGTGASRARRRCSRRLW